MARTITTSSAVTSSTSAAAARRAQRHLIRARGYLVQTTLRRYNNIFKRKRALSGLNGRTNDYFALEGIQEVPLRRQLMSSQEASRVRVLRKLCRANKAVSEATAEKKTRENRFESVVVGGGCWSKSWVAGGRLPTSPLRNAQELAASRSGRGPVSEGRKERVARFLCLEARSYGGYRAMR